MTRGKRISEDEANILADAMLLQERIDEFMAQACTCDLKPGPEGYTIAFREACRVHRGG